VANVGSKICSSVLVGSGVLVVGGNRAFFVISTCWKIYLQKVQNLVLKIPILKEYRGSWNVERPLSDICSCNGLSETFNYLLPSISNQRRRCFFAETGKNGD